MKKEKEAEVVDSREVEVDLMEKVVDLIVLCKIKVKSEWKNDYKGKNKWKGGNSY